MSEQWKILPVQPLGEGDEVSIGELLQVIRGLYAGLFVEATALSDDGGVYVQTVGLRSILIASKVPRDHLTRDSIPRRYLLGRIGYYELQHSLEQQRRRQEYQRRRKQLVHQHQKALRKQLRDIHDPRARQELVETSQGELTRLLDQLAAENPEQEDQL